MKKIIFLIIISFGIYSCNDYVSDYEKPNDSIGDEQFTTAKDAQFLITGVEGRFAIAYGQATSYVGGLSDELSFTTDIQGASFVTFRQINLASTLPPLPMNNNNNSIAALFNNIQSMRKHAVLLVDKTENQIVFQEGEESIRDNALFTGHFYNAVAEYFLGAFYGKDPMQQGGVVDVGPFIPANDMYQMALTSLDKALESANENQTRMINTFKARIYMLLGNTGMAETSAASGMVQGDAPVNALYNTLNSNNWHFDSGNGRVQWYSAERFGDYLVADPSESVRLAFRSINGIAKDEDGNSINTYLIQNKYSGLESPIRFLGWQENELILAELEIAAGGNGLNNINNVRTGYSLSTLDQQHIDDNYGGNAFELLVVERDKELFGEAHRLLDQRRWDRWHLDKATSWLHFPIPLAEVNSNPNL